MEREPHHLSWENARRTCAIIYGRTDYRQLAILWMNIYCRKADIYEGLTGSFARERADNLYLPALEEDGIIRKGEHGAWEFVKDFGPSFQFGGGGEAARVERAHMAAAAAQEVASEFSVARKAAYQRSVYLRLAGQSVERCLEFLDSQRDSYLKANDWPSEPNESATMDLVFLALINTNETKEARR
jgi:hypothetical protein